MAFEKLRRVMSFPPPPVIRAEAGIQIFRRRSYLGNTPLRCDLFLQSENPASNELMRG